MSKVDISSYKLPITMELEVITTNLLLLALIITQSLERLANIATNGNNSRVHKTYNHKI